MDKCPICGTKVRTAGAESPSQSEKAIDQSNEYLDREIPSVNLPEIKRLCPLCAMEVDDTSDRCPRCGIPLRQEPALQEEPKSCPECGALSPASEKNCVKCGARFAAPPSTASKPYLGTIPPRTVAPPSTETIPRHPVTTPATKGFTNGRRGAVNGSSVALGKGGTSGQGMINGTGVTNGTGVSELKEVRLGKSKTHGLKWQFYAILVAIAVVIPLFIFIAYPGGKGMAVDGDFDDWNNADMFGMQVPAGTSEIAVDAWSVHNQAGSLFFYIDAEDNLMVSSNVDSYFVFVDSDNDPGTGYSVCGMGAEYLLEVDGWEGQVRSTSVMEFGPSTDETDWNGWSEMGYIDVSVVSNKLEGRAELPDAPGPDARYLLVSQANSPDQDYSVSYPVPEDGGLLIAHLEIGSSIDKNLGTVPAETSSSFARLMLTCDGAGGDITQVNPTVLGASLSSSFGDIHLARGESKSLDVKVDTSSSAKAALVSVVLGNDDFISSFGDVTILQNTVSAYVSSAPASIEIDGAFGDWVGRTVPDNDSSAVSNSNIDMTATGFADMPDFAAFYISVEGQMFQGVYAPSAKAKPTGGGGGGGSIIVNRRSGEDVLRIYIDSDLSISTGLSMVRATKTIGADYLIDVRGVNGKIMSKSIQMYDGTDWILAGEDISVAKDAQQLELSVPTTSIGGATMFAAIVETTDWRARGDWAWTGSVLDPWVIDEFGNTYMSTDGSTWSYLGTPTLEPGDRVVDIAVSIGSQGGDIFLVTNTGRTYYWVPDTSTNWTAGETNPIDTATYSEAVSMTFYQNAGAWLLTQNGSYFYLMDAHKSTKQWTYQDVAAVGVTDFTDIVYLGGTMYALRSGANTTLSYSNNGNSFTALTNPTGSIANHTQFTYIGNGPGPTDDQIFVLCENGDIRYSSDGGQTWSSLGDLPPPSTNTTAYVGLGFDPAGYLWVVNSDGQTYRSTDTTTFNNFTFMGQAPIGDIVAILPTTVVIPEFSYMLLPVLCTLFLLVSRRIVARRKVPR